MQEAADNIQTEILELISTLSEPTTSDTASSVSQVLCYPVSLILIGCLDVPYIQ